MPAGDAGLEQQPVDAEYRTICGWVTKYGWLNAAMAERVRQFLHRQQAQIRALSATPNIIGCVARVKADGSLEHETTWRETADEHLKRDAFMQAVVDAARDYRQSVIDMMHVMETGGDAWRMARERRVNAESRMFSGLAALDKAQAAQPEGEQA